MEVSVLFVSSFILFMH